MQRGTRRGSADGRETRAFRAFPPQSLAGLGGMRIAILGTRGIPANYGGFETFAEELALASRRADTT